MKKMLSKLLFLCFIIINTGNFSCYNSHNKTLKICKNEINVGAEQTNEYFNLLKGKRIGVVANHTSLIGNVLLVDSLLHTNINVVKIFSPEHGFRGFADAGETVINSIDKITGLPIVSLYGKNFKPSAEDLKGIDIMIFDIQDVGVRFFTYISTMHYVMEACAENNVELLILDRPNPNGFYVDGPVLDVKYKSFVGLDPIPIVYGMTIAEYAQMINGEFWMKDSIKCNLNIVKCKNYTHSMKYKLPVPPSPNLQTMGAVYLYPFLGIFEGTCVSVGRGTDYPFQIFGHPNMKNTNFSFIPESRPGFSKNPKFLGKNCFGIDLRNDTLIGVVDSYRLEMIKYAYENIKDKKHFFNSFFSNLVGNESLKNLIILRVSSDSIKSTWQNDINKFMEIRSKYLLYPDF